MWDTSGPFFSANGWKNGETGFCVKTVVYTILSQKLVFPFAIRENWIEVYNGNDDDDDDGDVMGRKIASFGIFRPVRSNEGAIDGKRCWQWLKVLY